MGEWALRSACRQCEEWQRAGLGLIRVSVNVSSRQFRVGQLVEMVRSLAEGGGFDLRYLTLELTEGTIMENPEETCAMLRAIKDMGALISVDDFGTGYSSLSYLKRFPLDELKIDRSFIQGVPHAADDAAIVKAIVGLAHSLGFRVVAEGVESEDQLSFLGAIGCDEYQGFLRSRVIPPEEWPELLGSDPSRMGSG
jgi:EAL domain-containing protein (putative c-di-GMP-specific phosphodiesterase class I)